MRNTNKIYQNKNYLISLVSNTGAYKVKSKQGRESYFLTLDAAAKYIGITKDDILNACPVFNP